MADTTETVQAEPGLWAAIGQSVRGSHVSYDYTSGSIGRSILLLAVPMVLEMVMESVFVVCDVFFVGKLGADAVATVGYTESMMTLVYTLAIGLGIGTTATVARRVGERDQEGAARTAGQTLILGMIVSVALGAAGVLLAPRLLAVMGASPSVIESGSNFTRVMLGGCASVVMLFLVNAIFRGAGDAAIAMRVLWLANIINIALGPCLIFGLGPFPELGVAGAAVATTTGRAVGALYALSKLLRPGGRIHVARHHLALAPDLMWRLVRLSASGAFQVFIGMASWIGLVRIISTFGSQALAGYTIGIRIILFALLPSWGLSNAAATMVGQALGAGKPERAERAVWQASRYNLYFLGSVGLVFVLFAGTIVGPFTPDPVVRAYAVDCLRIVASGFLFYAYGMVIAQSFNGAGDTRTPTVINLFVFWLWEIPLAYVLSFVFRLGPRGVFLAVTVAFSTLAVVSALLFRRGRWKTRVV
ncbi:MAG TPA: MATE family efflux transporter [Pyrinomonadaceae bacterium]|jgi:putative MATE family efflux protein|nr:MATE family efflux transporter [Pyrinomonadaceae bacterium]